MGRRGSLVCKLHTATVLPGETARMMKSAQGDKDSPTPEFLDKYKKRTRKSVEKLLARIFKTKLLIITLGIEMDAKQVLAIPVSIVVG